MNCCVWSDSFVEEANVSRIVHTLRKVLGEDDNGNKFIETVAKKGYRFVAEVEKISKLIATQSVNGAQNSSLVAENLPEIISVETLSEAESPISPPEKVENVAPPVSKSKNKNRLILFTIVSLCAVCLILLLSFNWQSKSFFASKEPQSIAVLPLKSLKAEDRDAIYQFGVAEALILKLNSTRGMMVRPLSAIRKYSDVEQDALTAGREQKVDYVLDSNYQLAEGKVRVTSELINVQTGAIEETLRSEKDSADVFTMQDSIANEFGNILLERFGKPASNVTAKRYTSNEEAYRLYLQGMILADKENPEDDRKAAELFDQAINLDPNYALAYVGLAYAHRTISVFGGNPHEEYQISKSAVEKALQLDSNSAEAFTVLGEIQDTYEWNVSAAEKSYLRAIELNPNSAFAHRFYALHLMHLSRFDEAIPEANAAIALDPNSAWDQRVLGMILFFDHRYDEAITQFSGIVEKGENASNSYLWISSSFEQKGDFDQAFDWFVRAETQRSGASAKDINLWKTIYAQSGWQGILRRQLELLKQDEKNGGNPYFAIASSSAKLGDKEQAFFYLEKSYQKRDFGLFWLRIRPDFDSLRSDARFENLARHYGLPQ